MDEQLEHRTASATTDPHGTAAARPVVRIELALTAFTRRSRSISISHLEHDLPRGLDRGEHVLLEDPTTRTHWTGIVADVDFSADDTHYRLELGTRITSAETAQWLDPGRSRPAGGLSTGDVAELLIALRRSQQGLRDTYRGIVAESAAACAATGPAT
ncbi:hypothetical protein [Nocardioides sambongensis]|uniref:hypothetical protein n=1 Tax=Nocardioides sambongensis TaxID=2589074 RepID=UPI00112E797B|nr:hypothetical protein [Nocardioides sambongensis]